MGAMMGGGTRNVIRRSSETMHTRQLVQVSLPPFPLLIPLSSPFPPFPSSCFPLSEKKKNSKFCWRSSWFLASVLVSPFGLGDMVGVSGDSLWPSISATTESLLASSFKSELIFFSQRSKMVRGQETKGQMAVHCSDEGSVRLIGSDPKVPFEGCPISNKRWSTRHHPLKQQMPNPVNTKLPVPFVGFVCIEVLYVL